MLYRVLHKQEKSSYFLSGNRDYKHLLDDKKEVFDKAHYSTGFIEYFPNQENKTIEDFKKDGYEVNPELFLVSYEVQLDDGLIPLTKD